jgi:hypothetical protein
MTLPIFLAVHLAYGVLMAFVMERRMRSEGEVLGLPLVFALVPVAFVSAPLSALLVRYAGGYFLHGAFIGTGSIDYERFQFGILLAVGFAGGLAAAIGLVFSIAVLSRDARRFALAPLLVSALTVIVTLVVDPTGVFVIAGTGGATILQHPVGLVSLGMLLALGAGFLFARARLSAPLELNA